MIPYDQIPMAVVTNAEFMFLIFRTLRLREKALWRAVLFVALFNFYDLCVTWNMMIETISVDTSESFKPLFIIVILGLWLIFDENLWKICFVLILADSLGGIALIIARICIPELIIMQTVLEILLFLIVYIGARRFLIKMQQNPLESPNIVIKILVVFWMSAMFFSIFPNYIIADEYLSTALEVLIGVATVMLVVVIQKIRNQKQKNQYLHLKQNIMQDYYQGIEKQRVLMNECKTDIEEQMRKFDLIIKRDYGELDRNEWNTYREGVEKQYSDFSEQVYSGIKIADTMLSNKIKTCKENNIAIDIQIDWGGIGCIEKEDMLSLLFNLIDNAIESCMKIEDIHKRYISIVGRRENQKIELSIKNARNPQRALKKGEITSKKDKTAHGFGLQIVEKIVEKYAGNTCIEETDDEFNIEVRLRYIPQF